MSVVPSGEFSLRAEQDRLELTIAGTLYGEHRFVFDRRTGLLERDGQPVCALKQISSVEVQAIGLGEGLAHSFMLVIGKPGGFEHLYVNEHKDTVAELAAQVGQFIGVRVTHREQPFQRQFRERFGVGGPTGDGPFASPVRARRSIQGAMSLWSVFVQAVAGGMLLLMSGLVIGTAASQTMMLGVGAVIGLIGVALLGRAVYGASRHLRGGSFQLDPGFAPLPSEQSPDARFAPPTAEMHQLPGLFAIVGRTNLLLALIVVAAGTGVMILTVVTEVEGSAAAGFLVGLLFASIGGFLVWKSCTQVGIWRAIRADPMPVEAVVQHVQQMNRRPPRFAIVYQYRDASGHQQRGQSFPLTMPEADCWRPLDVAAVLVNRRRPEQSMLAGLRPLRRSSREERYPDGDAKLPPRWPGAGPDAE